MELRFERLSIDLSFHASGAVQFMRVVNDAWHFAHENTTFLQCFLKAPMGLGDGWCAVPNVYIPRSYWGRKPELVRHWSQICESMSALKEMEGVVCGEQLIPFSIQTNEPVVGVPVVNNLCNVVPFLRVSK